MRFREGCRVIPLEELLLRSDTVRKVVELSAEIPVYILTSPAVIRVRRSRGLTSLALAPLSAVICGEAQLQGIEIAEETWLDVRVVVPFSLNPHAAACYEQVLGIEPRVNKDLGSACARARCESLSELIRHIDSARSLGKGITFFNGDREARDVLLVSAVHPLAAAIKAVLHRDIPVPWRVCSSIRKPLPPWVEPIAVSSEGCLSIGEVLEGAVIVPETLITNPIGRLAALYSLSVDATSASGRVYISILKNRL